MHDSLDDTKTPAAEFASMRRKRSLARWLIQAAILVLVAVFLTLAIQTAIAQLRASPEVLSWDRVQWLPFMAGWILTLIALFPAGIAWFQTLRDFQLSVPARHGAYAYFLGHLGKYVPGKAMAIVLRVGYLHRLGISVRPTILSVFIETLTSLASGSILGAILLQTMSVPPWLKVCALACIPLAALALVPKPFRWLIERLSRSRLGAMPQHVAEAIQWRLMLRCGTYSAVGWLLHGTAAWMLLMAIDPASDLLSWRAWSTCVSSMALAALAGFVSMIPGGAGVRELVATWGIATLVPMPVALASAVITRLAAIAAELIVLGVLAFWVHAAPSNRLPNASR